MSDAPDNAQVRIAPPILILLCLIAGWCLDQGQHWPILSVIRWHGLRAVLSGALILFGVGLVLYCARLFKQAQTPIEPWRPTANMITSGPYRFSRNPIYLGIVIAGAGIALAFDSWWMLFSVLAFALIANKHVIEREEAYLERKFGEAYSSYRSETRRWL